jgi:hypothetical protein
VFDPGPIAEAVFKEWYCGAHRRFTETATEDVENWAGRRHDHAMRAAVLLHLLDTGDVEGMDETATRRGIAFIEAMEPGMFEAYGMLGQSEWGSVWTKMVELIRKKPGIQLRHLMAAASRWTDSPGKAPRAAKDMLESGMLRREGEGGTMRLWLMEEEDGATSDREGAVGSTDDRHEI